LTHKEPSDECKFVPEGSFEGYVKVTLDNTLFPHEWFYDYIIRVGLHCEDCGNEPSPIEAGDSLEIRSERYMFAQNSVDQFNIWMHVGMPVPFVFINIQSEDGTNGPIHATEIAESLRSLTGLTRQE